MFSLELQIAMNLEVVIYRDVTATDDVVMCDENVSLKRSTADFTIICSQNTSINGAASHIECVHTHWPSSSNGATFKDIEGKRTSSFFYADFSNSQGD